MPETTVAATLFIDVAGYLRRQGVPMEKLCTRLNIPPTVLEQPNARLPGSLMERLWAEGERLTGDTHLGLHTAEVHNPGALDIAGYVFLSCRSPREALERLARYAALLNEGLRVSISAGDEGRTLLCRCEPGAQPNNYVARSPRQVMEAMAAGIVITIRRLTTAHVEPLGVRFRHAAPESLLDHHRILGANVRFGQPDNCIEFRAADLDAGLLSANPALLEIFEARARALLDQLDARGPVSRRVLAALAARINGRVPPLGEVAGALAMSPRTLQRELLNEQTSYRLLLDTALREIAMEQLSQPGRSAADVAFLLGFSEPSAFTRAFRRWTGTPPTLFHRPPATTTSDPTPNPREPSR